MKIKLKSRSKTIYTVVIDNENWGILPGKVLRFFSLFSDIENELPEERRLELIAEIEKYVWNNFLNYLAYRERSAGECFTFLRGQMLPSHLIEKLLEKAIANNFINDERFADLYVQDLMQKNKNRTQIKTKLYEKKIAGSIIEKVLAEYFSKEQIANILSANYQIAVRRFHSHPVEKRKEKILNYLTRKGFPYWEVKEKLDKEGY